MKSALTIFLLTSLLALSSADLLSLKALHDSPIVDGFRPPAVPLIVFDPYMSIWSMGDHLYDDFTKLWCGTIKALSGIIRVDGTPYRYMGPEQSVPVHEIIAQKSVKVLPTQTFYVFQNDKITFELTFSTPTIPTDLDLLSQPVSYITYKVSSNDGNEHQVEVYFDQTAEIAVHTNDQQINWSRPASTVGGPKYVMAVGTTEQKVIGKNGDSMGIDWGYAYLAVTPVDQNDDVRTVIANSSIVRTQFAQTGAIPTQDEATFPRQAQDNWPAMAVMWSFKVNSSQNQTRFLTFAYDDIYSINYFGTMLPAYWKRTGNTAADMITDAVQSYSQRLSLLNDFDKNHLANLTAVEGPNYATIASLSFRQAFGACKLVWNAATNTPWYFMKEISSDGNLQTADVIFPASPIFLYTNPYLLQLLIVPLLAYGNNETNVKYNLAWAPHDLGEWPLAFKPPEQQEQMPVEETGNLIQMIAALTKYSQQQGKAYDSLIFPKYKPLIESWATYLTAGDGVLPNPGNQLCTDDFLGPIPQSVNLALKGIVALGNYVEVCKIQGDYVCAVKYDLYTKNFVNYWLSNGTESGHSKRQYDQSGTWSLKYNLLYQYIVGTTIFPDSVIENEMVFYATQHLNDYGIPLDNKADFTKLDWEAWIAAMCPDPIVRTQIFDRIYRLAHETPQRVPLTDWYDTVKGTQNGFQARSVVGGFYARMLTNPKAKTLFETIVTKTITA